VPWLFAFPLEVSVPGRNKSTEMEQRATARAAAEALLQGLGCLEKERKKGRNAVAVSESK